MPADAETLQKTYEPRPDPQELTNNGNLSQNSSGGVDYEPYPHRSIPISPEREHIVKNITNLYSGSASEEDMRVYAEEAIYDDPWSYCDTRYKIAGQWYGIPKLFNSTTLATEIVASTSTTLSFKLRQHYSPKLTPSSFSKAVNSLITLTLIQCADGGVEKVKYHKDMWNEKDYSHEGLGKLMKSLNGEYLTKITQPPETL